GAAREAQAEEPAHEQHRESGQGGAGDRIGGGVDAGAQDAAADRLADGEADAGAQAPADDQHEHGAERSRARVVDLEVVEDVPRGGGAQQDAHGQPDVLGKRQPEAAPIPVGDAADGGDQDEDVDEVDQSALPSNTLGPLGARNAFAPR